MSLASLQGPVFLADRNASTGLPENYAWSGNSPEVTVSLSTDELEHQDSYTGYRLIDGRIITKLSANISITVDDIKEANFVVASFGQAAAIAGGAVTGEAVITAAPKLGERYSLKSTGRVSAVTLYDNAVAITSTKYEVDPSGVIVFSDVTGMTGPITADYTNAASRQVGVFKTGPTEKHVRVDGFNTAVTVAGDFQRYAFEGFKTRMNPFENLGLINNEFISLVMTGSILADPFKAASSATGQFMRLIYFD